MSDRMTESDREELRDVWDELQKNYDYVKQIIRRHVDRNEYERVRAYGFLNVEAGLGIGDAMPSFDPINVVVERLLEEPEDDQESEDGAEDGDAGESGEGG